MIFNIPSSSYKLKVKQDLLLEEYGDWHKKFKIFCRIDDTKVSIFSTFGRRLDGFDRITNKPVYNYKEWNQVVLDILSGKDVGVETGPVEDTMITAQAYEKNIKTYQGNK